MSRLSDVKTVGKWLNSESKTCCVIFRDKGKFKVGLYTCLKAKDGTEVDLSGV